MTPREKAMFVSGTLGYFCALALLIYIVLHSIKAVLS